MRRYGSVIGVRPESLAAYNKYPRGGVAGSPRHDPGLQHSELFHLLKDDLLFGYFEYHGADYAADIAKMAADPKTQKWWAIMMPMQKPLETHAAGEWWATMEEVFHSD